MKHYLPLERIEERYTPMMNDCLNPFFDFIYYPEMDTTTIDKGEFLDVEKTIEFKAKQLALVAQSFQQGNVKNGDVFFVADIFYPGINYDTILVPFFIFYLDVIFGFPLS